MNKRVFSVRDLTMVAIMAAILSVCAWISIPSAVPFTLQTFAVFMALKLLGGRNGTIAILLYLALGAIGLPVFSGFKGGVGALVGPTGGYLLGFLLTGLLYWILAKRIKNLFWEDAVLIMGLALCYLFGTIWFTYVMGTKGKEFTLIQAMGLCVFPYLIPDMLKLVLAHIVSQRVSGLIK